MTNLETIELTTDSQQTVIVSTRGDGFNKKKNELKAFSEKLPEEAELPSVPLSGGLFGLFNYDVTGSDLNRLTESIQDKMIEQNKVLVRTIQEFNTIYDTFSALDQEYIQGILVSLKAAEEANAKALKGIKGVQENQNEINQLINQQKQVIQVLKNFKEKIEKIEHLADVDNIFDVYSTMQGNVKAIEEKVETQQLRLADLIDEMRELLSSQSVFHDNLNQQYQTVKQLVSLQNGRLSNIETISTENKTNIETISTENKTNIETISTENKTNIETLKKEIASYGETLSNLKQLFREDIQTLSERIVRSNSDVETKLDSTINEMKDNKTHFENVMNETKVGIQRHEESMTAYLESELSRARNEITELSRLTESTSKLLKINRIISFSSIAISSVLALLLISGVL